MIERVLGHFRSDAPGPTLLVVGSQHGNEPAGATAGRNVVARLRAHGTRVRGELTALVGNTRALAAGRRYLARDLNRLWSDEAIAAARRARGGADEETIELVELAGLIDGVLVRARGPVYVLDLHTTSAGGTPFSVVAATPEGRAFAEAFPIPGVLGLEGTLPGVLTPYLAERGCITLAIEGGQNESPIAVGNHEAAIVAGMIAAGVVDPADLPGAADATTRLTLARGTLPHLIEVVSRHPIEPGDGFRMEPGFANIHYAAAGTLLARDRRGEIRAPHEGYVLLPLYQAQGSDGFFFGRALT